MKHNIYRDSNTYAVEATLREVAFDTLSYDVTMVSGHTSGISHKANTCGSRYVDAISKLTMDRQTTMEIIFHINLMDAPPTNPSLFNMHYNENYGGR